MELPSTLTNIGENAFDNCACLVDIELPSSLTSIDDYAFKGCTSLPGINLPATLTSIGCNVFQNCINLQGPVVIPEGVTGISSYTFDGCASLNDVFIPDSVTFIGSYAFQNCTSLTGITLSGATTQIRDYAFAGCSELVTVGASDAAPGTSSNPNLAAWVFKDCVKLKSVTVPGGVRSVSHSSFYSCPALETVILREGITEITSPSDYYYWGAFQNCASLTKVELPSTLGKIGNSAFRNCISLHDIEIPASVTTIGTYAFEKCESLPGVSIPASLTSLGSNAFQNCISMAGTVTIPSGVTAIHQETFSECNSLENIEIQGNVTAIADNAFYNCRNVKSVVLSGSLSSIGSYSFYGCTSLESINLADQLTSVGSYAFACCYNLEDIYLGTSLNSIGKFAFFDCMSLASDLNIADGITVIRQSTFEGCEELRSITLPESVTVIETDAFKNCGKLTVYGGVNANIPSSARAHHFKYIWRDLFTDFDSGTIGNGIVWKYIPAIKVLIFWNDNSDASMPDWTEETYTSAPWYQYADEIVQIDFDEGITKVGDYAFYGYPQLTTVNLDSPSLTTIGAHAFERCGRLSSVWFGQNQLRTIGDYAFNYCYALSEIDLPSGISSVGENAFGGSSIKYYCAWKSPTWNLLTDLEYNVLEKPYTVRSDNNTVEMKHSVEYLIDKDPSDPELQFLCTLLSFGAYDAGTTKANFRRMGFETIRVGDGYSVGDHVGYVIGVKNTFQGEKIVLVAIRGSYGEVFKSADWISDFNAGPDSSYKHTGFHTAEQELYQDLKSRVNLTGGNVTVLITGHSRGAGVGNLLAADLIRNDLSAGKVIAYNVACPNVATNKVFTSVSCPYVYNLVNRMDLVTWVPLPGFSIKTDKGASDLLYSFIHTFVHFDESTLSPEKKWGRFGHDIPFSSGTAFSTILDHWDMGLDGIKNQASEVFRYNHMNAYTYYTRDVFYNQDTN